MGKGGAKGAKVSVTQYYRSLTVGVCTGEVDSLNAIYFQEKTGFLGPIIKNENFRINKPDLFGGVRREGGVSGIVSWRRGNANQKLSTALATRMGGTPDTLPGYRGIAHASFYSGENAVRPGFYFGANQPVMPDIWFNVTRLFDGWNADQRAINDGDNILRVAMTVAIDNSGSMADDDRDETAKAAMELVFDALANAITAFNLQLDIQVIRYGTTANQRTRTLATPEDIDELRAFVQNNNPSGVTNIGNAMDFIANFYSTRLAGDFDRRLMFVITDGEPTDDVAAAVATVSDLLDNENGDFNSSDGTAVEAYGVNIELTDTTETAKFDNTGGTVPVLQSDDVVGLSEIVQTAVFRGNGLDANPAHIVYEVLTNEDWGLGTPVADLDDASFLAAAQTLTDESLGLSLMWVEQATIQEFLQEILDHIEATLFVSPVTGLFELKLIRGDYDESALPVLDDSNSTTQSVSYRTPGEAVNELNVTWTNPRNEEEEVVTIQNLGGIVAAGGQIIPDNRNYYGVRSLKLAFELAKRDMTTLTAPIFTADVFANRDAADFVNGDVFKLTSEEHGLENEIVRIAKIDRGRAGRSEVRLKVTLDVFALDRPDYDDPEEEDLQDEGSDPTAITDVTFFTLNYFFRQEFITPSVEITSEYPDAFSGILAATDNPDALEYILYGPNEDAAGNTTEDDLGVRTICSVGQTVGDYPQEAVTTVTAFNALTDGEPPTVGGFALIGSSALPEDELELVLISDFDGTTWTLQRGILDTVPREWPEDTPIRFFDSDSAIADQITRADTETVSYKLLLQTSLGTLEADAAPTSNYTLNDRGEAPYRVANVLFEGSPWDNVDAAALALTEVDVSWSNRNRLTEDSQILAWNEADVTPEVGQTVALEFFDVVGGTVYRTTSGLTGTSYSIPLADFEGKAITEVRVFAERDGLRSFMAHTRRVVTASGYGRVYGVDYGGKF